MALRSWATGQTTPTRRRDAATLIALGAGAGLAVEDIAGLTAGMVATDDMGVLLAVPGRRSRLVPVLAEWEAPIV
ncbi:MAG: site-specific integrase, partial [Acidimicrobiales bacterium]